MKNEIQMYEAIDKVMSDLQKYKMLKYKINNSLDTLRNLYEDLYTSSQKTMSLLQRNIDDLEIAFRARVTINPGLFFDGPKEEIEKNYNKKIKLSREVEKEIQANKEEIDYIKKNSIITNDFYFDNNSISYILSQFSNPNSYSIYKGYIIHNTPIYYRNNEENDEGYFPILHYSKKLGLFILKITFINKRLLGLNILIPKPIAAEFPSGIQTITDASMIYKYFYEISPFIGDRFIKSVILNHPFDSAMLVKIIIELLDGLKILDFQPYTNL